MAIDQAASGVTAGERRHRPQLLAGAITESNAEASWNAGIPVAAEPHARYRLSAI